MSGMYGAHGYVSCLVHAFQLDFKALRAGCSACIPLWLMRSNTDHRNHQSKVQVAEGCEMLLMMAPKRCRRKP